MVISHATHAFWQVPVQVFPVAMQQIVDQQHNTYKNYDTTAQQNCANQKGCGTLNSHVFSFSRMERRARIELATLAWKAKVIPFYERRNTVIIQQTVRLVYIVWQRVKESNL
jgi:hypothetical protein